MKPRIKVITLSVRDLAAALVFYRDGMGLPTQGIIGQEFEDGAVVFHLQVADETEAIAIAQHCPGLEYGCVVEVRPMAERCTVRARALDTSAAR